MKNCAFIKIVYKLLAFLLIGFCICFFVYPFLHEGGHFLAANALGAKVSSLSLGARANVRCRLSETSYSAAFQNAVISISGLLLPMLFGIVLLLVSKKISGLICFGILSFSLITTLSSIIGALVAVLAIYGNEPCLDDVSIFIYSTNTNQLLVFICFILYAVFTIFLIIKTKIIKKNINYLSRE